MHMVRWGKCHEKLQYGAISYDLQARNSLSADHRGSDDGDGTGSVNNERVCKRGNQAGGVIASANEACSVAAMWATRRLNRTDRPSEGLGKSVSTTCARHGCPWRVGCTGVAVGREREKKRESVCVCVSVCLAWSAVTEGVTVVNSGLLELCPCHVAGALRQQARFEIRE